MAEGICRGCGLALPPTKPGAGRPREWCSERCRVAAYNEKRRVRTERLCVCAVSFVVVGKSAQVYCSPGCRKEAMNARLRQDQRFTCGHCGVEFERPPTRGQRPRWCSECRDRPRLRNPDLARFHDHRRRALKAGASIDRFSDWEIFERDGWRCQLCGRKVNPRWRHPHPKSASLDHVVPLSGGGEHSRRNVQLAHLACNVAKKARAYGSGEQLRLIG